MSAYFAAVVPSIGTSAEPTLRWALQQTHNITLRKCVDSEEDRKGLGQGAIWDRAYGNRSF